MVDFIDPYTIRERLLASCPGDRDDPEITFACDERIADGDVHDCIMLAPLPSWEANFTTAWGRELRRRCPKFAKQWDVIICS
jgi:hypothetical protein